MRRNFSFWQRLQRLVHHRLVVPIKRSPHPPEHTARAVMVGLFWALTPLVGVQMYLVFLTWLVMRRSPRFDFSLIIGLAWTWVTNVFTMWPIYYLFYATGWVLLGHFDGVPGYESFVLKWQAVLAEGGGFFETLMAQVRMIAQDQGLPLALGCVPYAFVAAWLGYRWSLKYVTRRRMARRQAFAGRTSRLHRENDV